MNSCPDLAELAGAEDQSADHPVREHLRRCGRCRASLRAFHAFRNAAGGEEVSDAELAIADGRLAEFIDNDLLDERSAAPIGPLRIRPARITYRGWLAAAAVLVVAVGISLVGSRLTDPDRGTGDELRGDTVPTAAGLASVAVTTTAPGEALVQWESVAGAQDYEIVLWTAALAEFARLAPRPETNRRLTWDVAADPAPAFFSVVARQGGREIARSELVNLP